jgi:hypothetical protein
MEGNIKERYDLEAHSLNDNDLKKKLDETKRENQILK